MEWKADIGMHKAMRCLLSIRDMTHDRDRFIKEEGLAIEYAGETNVKCIYTRTYNVTKRGIW